MSSRKCCRTVPCAACVGGTAPTELTFTLANMGASSQGCTGCAYLNGSWTIPFSSCWSNLGWRYASYTGAFPQIICGGQSWNVVVNIGWNGGMWSLEVDLYFSGGGQMSWFGEYTQTVGAQINCNALSNRSVTPFSGFSTSYCGDATSTCKVSA